MKVRFKHQGGGHSQKTHGRRRGGSGGALTGADLEAKGVEKIGNHWDYREAAAHGVGAYTKGQATGMIVGRLIDDYLPNGDKVDMRVERKGSSDYTVSHQGQDYTKQYHPTN